VTVESELLRTLAAAVCLVFVLEGIIPFLYPARWRKLVQQLSMMDDNSMRMMELVSMLIGVGLLYLIH